MGRRKTHDLTALKHSFSESFNMFSFIGSINFDPHRSIEGSPKAPYERFGPADPSFRDELSEACWRASTGFDRRCPTAATASSRAGRTADPRPQIDRIESSHRHTIGVQFLGRAQLSIRARSRRPSAAGRKRPQQPPVVLPPSYLWPLVFVWRKPCPSISRRRVAVAFFIASALPWKATSTGWDAFHRHAP